MSRELEAEIGLASVIEAIEPVMPDTSSGTAYERFRARPEIAELPVVDGTTPVGLIDRNHLTMSLAHRYGNALYAGKPVAHLMDARPLIVGHTMAVDDLEWTLANENPSALRRGFIVTRDGAYAGVASALSVLRLSMARTERRNQELEVAREKAEAASKSKSQFLSVVSHELRTPLNAIIGFSELMTTEIFGPIGEPRYLDYLGDIHNAANQLLGVINDVLDMAKIEQGKMELYEEPFDVKELVRPTVRLSEQANAAALTIATSLPATPVHLLADRRAVRHILTNLLANAVKFTPAGGRVAVDVRLGCDGGLKLSVADTGIGMTPEHIEIALLPFGQVESAHTRKYDGTGLGLPIVKSLVALHGATLDIESELDVGTIVRVCFPARRVLEWGLTGDPVWPEEMAEAG